jgi:hypothetical protein
MTRFDFLSYNDRPCKFRLRSGKVVFGVIWETKSGTSPDYRFASLGERYTIQMPDSIQESKNVGLVVDLEEVISAEPISLEALSA